MSPRCTNGSVSCRAAEGDQMRRLLVGAIASLLLFQVVPAASAGESVTDRLRAVRAAVGEQTIELRRADARALRAQIEMARGALLAPGVDPAAAAEARKLLAAVEGAVEVSRDAPPATDGCVDAWAFGILNTFQSLYYYWISYPPFGIFEVVRVTEEFVDCLISLDPA